MKERAECRERMVKEELRKVEKCVRKGVR
ncbi:hypothetical protein [Escherichia coli]